MELINDPLTRKYPLVILASSIYYLGAFCHLSIIELTVLNDSQCALGLCLIHCNLLAFKSFQFLVSLFSNRDVTFLWCFLQLFVVGGSSCASRPCLRVMATKKQKLKPFADLSNKSVRNTIVRASAFDQTSQTFFTGSEEGFLCCWRPEGGASEAKEADVGEKSTLKAKSSTKKAKKTANPY